jgi:hypothetical protein
LQIVWRSGIGRVTGRHFAAVILAGGFLAQSGMSEIDSAFFGTRPQAVTRNVTEEQAEADCQSSGQYLGSKLVS